MPGPGGGVGGVQSGQDGEAGDDSAGAADSASACDLDCRAGLCLFVERPDVPDGLVVVAGQEEIGPVDPRARPGKCGVVSVAQATGSQIEAEVGRFAVWRRTAQAAAADPGAVGELECADEGRSAHRAMPVICRRARWFATLRRLPHRSGMQ